MTLNLRLALLGLLTLSAGFNVGCHSNKACCGGDSCAAECAGQCKETPIAVADLPAAVVATVNKEAPGGTITEAEKCEGKDGVGYCVEVASAGKTWEMCVKPDGTLKKKELAN